MALGSKIKSSFVVKFNCILTILIVILLFVHYFTRNYKINKDVIESISSYEGLNPCCSFPCKNGGVCSADGTVYSCDCTRTGYSGRKCQIASWRLIITNPFDKLGDKTNDVIQRVSIIWKFMNFISRFQEIYNRNLYLSHLETGGAELYPCTAFDYVPNSNNSFNSRMLPPIPKNCPNAMGVRGPVQLPSTELIYKELFERKNFKPSSKGSNMFFAVYAQHFLQQFHSNKEDDTKQPDWLKSGVDMSHIYGKDEVTQKSLRLFLKGKLKTRLHLGEEYPPFVEDCYGTGVFRNYLSKVLPEEFAQPNWALTCPKFVEDPMLFTFATIWIREHNRVCNILAEEHKSWNDEKLYQTVKLIITGEALKITLTEYLQQLMQLNMKLVYKPEILFERGLHYTGIIPEELMALPSSNLFLPDEITVQDVTYVINNFKDNKIIFKHGMDSLITSMSLQPIGEITSNNIGEAKQQDIQNLIEHGRNMKLQSYNNYRRQLAMKPMENFEELTGDFQLARKLRNLYLDIEAVELVVGLLLERDGDAVSQMLPTVESILLVKTLMSHPLNSPEWWKPSTFGGKVGMNIVKSATLKKLFCLNLRSKCKNTYVDFKIPQI